ASGFIVAGAGERGVCDDNLFLPQTTAVVGEGQGVEPVDGAGGCGVVGILGLHLVEGVELIGADEPAGVVLRVAGQVAEVFQSWCLVCDGAVQRSGQLFTGGGVSATRRRVPLLLTTPATTWKYSWGSNDKKPNHTVSGCPAHDCGSSRSWDQRNTSSRAC